MKLLTPAERLVVAADFKPTNLKGKDWVRDEVLSLANKLKNTGVYLKVNSALRACGYDLIDEIHVLGLKVFCDLKFNDISETLSIDGALLNPYAPDVVTVMCSAGISGMKSLKDKLPETEVLGVTVLTSLKQSDTIDMFGSTVEGIVMRFAIAGDQAGIDGLVTSAKEIPSIRSVIRRPMSLYTPGVRPGWTIVDEDDQDSSRVMTPYKAIKAGADRVVVGRPITQFKDPYDATMRTIEEIEYALV